MSEAEAAWFLQQLVCAVQYCHRLGVAVRDIKACFLQTLSCCQVQHDVPANNYLRPTII